MEKELLEALKQIVDDFEDLNRGIVTQASINRAKRAIEAAQQGVQADVKPRTAQEELDALSDRLSANHAKFQKALRR